MTTLEMILLIIIAILSVVVITQAMAFNKLQCELFQVAKMTIPSDCK